MSNINIDLNNLDTSDPNNLGVIVTRIANDIHSFVSLMEYGAFCFGIWCIVYSLIELKNAHTFDKQGHAAGETSHAITYLFIGTALMFITTTFTAVGHTMFGEMMQAANYIGFSN